MDPPSPFKSSLLPLHLRAATRRAAIAGSTPPARELISSGSDQQSADGRESVVMCPPVGSAVGRSWSGEPTCRPARPHPTASHTAARPNNRPRHVCLPHRTPPPPSTASGSLLLTRWPASGLPQLGPRGRPASIMGPDVARWWRVALTHKPVADRLDPPPVRPPAAHATCVDIPSFPPTIGVQPS